MWGVRHRCAAHPRSGWGSTGNRHHPRDIVGPLAILLIMLTIGAGFVRPEIAQGAGYIAIMAVVLLFIMPMYGTLVSMFQ